MTAIAGTTKAGAEDMVERMLGLMQHRGRGKMYVAGNKGTTFGIAWNGNENVEKFQGSDRISDCKGSFHCSWAEPGEDHFKLSRDKYGVAPLYYGYDPGGVFYFASEVKALIPFVKEIRALPAGYEFDGKNPKEYHKLTTCNNTLKDDPSIIAAELKKRIEGSVSSFIRSEDTGSWLSGGLDSSIICCVASRHLKSLKTFAAGVAGAPDLEFARAVSDHLRTKHQEVIVTEKDLISKLPEVIYHLESFDALLVRSSITNFLVAKRASDYVSEVFSGEGGDELFAGYEYLGTLPLKDLGDELTRITVNLQNTALQRVDRCSSASGTTAFVPFLHPDVVEYAFSIPVKYKLYNKTEKWILRQAFRGDLPDAVIERKKSKFWEGAGVRDIISEYAGKKITDKDFNAERNLENGWKLNTKEELMYYRIFCEQYGSDFNLEWMGRTPGSPGA